MAERKTQKNKASVEEFLEKVTNKTRRADSFSVLTMMQAVSAEKPAMWGPSIVGFGTHCYSLANGKEADICKIGFAPRAQTLVFYLANFKQRAEMLQQLGKHKISGGGCLYINKLADIDFDVLRKIVDKAYNKH